MIGCRRQFIIGTMICLAGTLAGDGQGSQRQFEVVSIHRSASAGEPSFEVTATGLHAKNTPLYWLVMQAYFPRPTAYWRDDRIKNAPAWLMDEHYDIEARVSESEAEAFKKLSEWELSRRMQPMLQELLVERCHAQVQTTESEVTFSALTAAPHGAKILSSSSAVAKAAISLEDGGGMQPLSTQDGRRGFRFTHISMPVFAEVLSGLGTSSDLPIEDRTHLKGCFDFDLTKQDADEPGSPLRATEWDLGPLGLEMKRTRGMTPSLNVVHIERPTPN